jgi:hypothetical protein
MSKAVMKRITTISSFLEKLALQETMNNQILAINFKKPPNKLKEKIFKILRQIQKHQKHLMSKEVLKKIQSKKAKMNTSTKLRK